MSNKRTPAEEAAEKIVRFCESPARHQYHYMLENVRAIIRASNAAAVDAALSVEREQRAVENQTLRDALESARGFISDEAGNRECSSDADYIQAARDELQKIDAALSELAGRTALESKEVENQTLRDGIELIAQERQRQVEKEGWTPEHDDTHRGSELAISAACYAILDVVRRDTDRGLFATFVYQAWPFGSCDYKPTPEDRIRELTKSGALIAAEIDRLQRAALSESETTRE